MPSIYIGALAQGLRKASLASFHTQTGRVKGGILPFTPPLFTRSGSSTNHGPNAFQGSTGHPGASSLPPEP